MIRLLGISTLLLQIGPAPAVSGQPTAETTAGLGGYYRVGSWLPVAVTLENQGLDWEGSLVLSTDSTSLERQVTLPAPSRKTYFLELPTTGRLVELGLRLTSTEGELGWQVPLQAVPQGRPFFVAVSEGAASRPWLQQADGYSQDVWSRLRAEALPRGWRSFEGVDAVVLESSSAGLLRPLQRQALNDWLLLGGQLVLTASDPSRLKPVLLEWGLIPDELDEPVFEMPKRFRQGKGTLYLMSTSESDAAIGPLRESLLRQRQVEVMTASADPARWVPVEKASLPSPMGTLTFFFASYLVCIGLVLWQAGSTHSTLTVILGLSIATAVFTVGSCSLSHFVHGGRLIGHSSSIVWVFPQEPESFITTVARIATPVEGSIQVRGRGRAAFVTTEATENNSGLVVRMSDDEWQSVPVKLWQKQLLSAGGFVDTGLGVERSNGEPALVRNDSSLDLIDCRLLDGDSETPVGDLPVGSAVRYEDLERADQEAPLPLEEGNHFLLERYLASRRRLERTDQDKSLVCVADGELGVLESDPEWHPVGGSTLVIFQLKVGGHQSEVLRTVS